MILVMKTSRPTQGFSLVEVVLSIGMLSFSLVGLLGLMPMVLGSVRESMNLTTQTLIIQELSSEVQTMDYSQLTNSAAFSSTFPRAYNDVGALLPSSSSAQETAFQVTVSVSACQVPATASSSSPARQLTFQILNNHKKSDKNVYNIWIVDNGR